MANTLTNLIPDLYEGLDIVSRELTGFIPSVNMNSGANRASLNETVRVPTAGTISGVDITPAMTVPTAGDISVGNNTVTISKSRAFPFALNGEEQRGLGNAGIGGNVKANLFAQALRACVNEVETDIGALYNTASRATGTSGTTPFASTLTDTAQARKVLADNGAPMSDLQMVINTTAGANMRTLTNLTKANEASDTSLLRQGVLLDVHGFAIRESAQVADHTKGTGASATTDTAGYAVGDTVITLASAGTGTIVAGDVITFAGDTNQYVVVSGDADVSGGGTITLAEPGLKVAIATSATAITVTNSYSANMAFDRNAIVLATRAPALPEEGDIAVDREIITDPRSGLTVEVAMYAGYRTMRYEVALAWGASIIKPEHVAILKG